MYDYVPNSRSNNSSNTTYFGTINRKIVKEGCSVERLSALFERGRGRQADRQRLRGLCMWKNNTCDGILFPSHIKMKLLTRQTLCQKWCFVMCLFSLAKECILNQKNANT